MRVVPAQGMVLRDPRTRRLVDPELGVEVDPHDVTFAWLLGHGDCVELSDEAYAAALEKREADETAAAAEAAKVSAQLEAAHTPATVGPETAPPAAVKPAKAAPDAPAADPGADA